RCAGRLSTRQSDCASSRDLRLERVMHHWHLVLALIATWSLNFSASAADPADLIVHNAKVVTLDGKSSISEAVAARDGKPAAVGTNADILKLKGDKTRIIDAKGKMVLPGLYDSHAHPVGAALSEAGDPIPDLRSIPEILDFVKKRAATTPDGKWI